MFTLLNKSSQNFVASIAQSIVNVGAAWVRLQTNWASMETVDNGNRGLTLGNVNWAQMDLGVAASNAAGLQTYLTVQNAPAWHCGPPCGTHNVLIPNALDFVAFFEAMVSRYNGLNGFGHIEAAAPNEDFDQYAAGWPGDGNTTYACRDFTILQTIYPYIYPYTQTNNPGCLVGTGSILGKRTDTTHISTLVSEIPFKYCDFVDLHAYNCLSDPNYPNANNNDPSFPARLAAIRTEMKVAGHGNKDIWMTEFGWKDTVGNTPDACDITNVLQSQYMLEAITIGQSYNVSHFGIYTIGDNENDSITTSGNTCVPKLAWTNLQAFIAAPNGSGGGGGQGTGSGNMPDVTLAQSGSANGAASPATEAFTGVIAHDLLICIIAAIGISPTIATPTGDSWTQVQKTSGTNVSTAMYILPNAAAGTHTPSSVLGGIVTGWVLIMLEFTATGANCGLQGSAQAASAIAQLTNLFPTTGQTLASELFVYTVARATATITAQNTWNVNNVAWSISVQPQAGVQGLSVDTYWSSSLGQGIGQYPQASGLLGGAVASVAIGAWFNTTAQQPQAGDTIDGVSGILVGGQYKGMIGG